MRRGRIARKVLIVVAAALLGASGWMLVSVLRMETERAIYSSGWSQRQATPPQIERKQEPNDATGNNRADAMVLSAPEMMVDSKLASQIPRVVILDDPDATHQLEDLKGLDFVKLRGKVHKLIVSSVEGAAVLDASDLTAREIEVTGDIKGDALVRLNAPQGKVLLPGTIGDRAAVVINASLGTVYIGKTEDEVAMNGMAALQVTARRVEFFGIVGGAAEIDVNLDGGWPNPACELGFVRLTGSASFVAEGPIPMFSKSDRHRIGTIDKGARYYPPGSCNPIHFQIGSRMARLK